MTERTALWTLMRAAAVSAAALVVACGSAPQEQSEANDQASTSCAPGYIQSCRYDDEMMKNVCTCAKAKELDSCTPDTDPSHDTSKTWLANAGCVSLTGHVVARIEPSVDGYKPPPPTSPVTFWTCSQAAAIPAGSPKIFGDPLLPCPPSQLNPCSPGQPDYRAKEHVVIAMPNQPQLPACNGFPTSSNDRCTMNTVSSSCYPDPGPDQFVVAEWYDLELGPSPGPCNGAACMCTVLCGPIGD